MLDILAKEMMDPALAQKFAETFTAEWNRLAGQQHQVRAQLQRDLDAADRKHANLVEAIAGGLRSSALQTRLSAAEAEKARIETALAKAKPSPIRLMPNLGIAYRQTVETLREKLATGNNTEALKAGRALIDRVVIHPAPRGKPPTISVDGHLAPMLVAAQPNLSEECARSIAQAASLPVKGEPGGKGPLRALGVLNLTADPAPCRQTCARRRW